MAQQFLKKSKVNTLKWLPQRSDLNAIENLWAILESKIPPSKRTNKKEFYEVLSETWNSIGIEFTSKLVNSMPRHLEAVVKARHCAKKY